MGHLVRIIIAIGAVTSALSAQQTAEYLADHPERIVHVAQGWGELGINVAAHAPGQQPLKLAIKDKQYERGLGHHAPGEIVIELNGRYARFEAEVGVQNQPSGQGSAVFQVYADDRKLFDSGVMRGGEAPKSISVALGGTQELRLVATDAGDGINCDCANWAEARLIRDANATTRPASGGFEVARFARVVTCDPRRMDGARSNRIQEYRAEDVYLETDLKPAGDGSYAIPAYEGQACIGLKWLERRTIRELAIEFAQAPDPAAVEKAQVQCWAGESPWQGRWVTLSGRISSESSRWTFHVQPAGGLRGGTWKIRWIIPSSKTLAAKKLVAMSPARTRSEDILIVLDGDARDASVELYNGEFPNGETKASLNFARGQPRILSIRHVISRSWESQQTVLRIHLPQGAFAVAIDDVLAKGGVYVPAFGAVVEFAELGGDPARWRNLIAGRQTILRQVNRLPDQTLEQALKRVHHAAQDLPPTMLSLACDNRKFIVHRDGTVQFAPPAENDQAVPADRQNYPYQLKPTFGSGKNAKTNRHLDGGWLPAVVTRVEEDGLVYSMRSFVAPWDAPQTRGNPWLGAKPLFVAEFTVENTIGQPRNVSMRLKFDGRGINLIQQGGRLFVATASGPVGFVDPTWFQLEPNGGAVLNVNLRPGEKSRATVCIPGWRIAGAEEKAIPGDRKLFDDFGSYWKAILSGAMQIEVPDPLLMNLIRASQVHCLIAARNEDSGRRIAPWIASVSYGPLESESNSIIRGMDFLGHHEFAQRSLDYFLARHNPAGFLTTGYTLMGTGWHLWTLGEHYRLARDRQWLADNADKIARCCEWVIKQRAKTRAEGALESGLTPPGIIADWNAFAYYFCLNGYYCAGLRSAAEALKDIDRADADAMLRDAAAFREDILRAYRAVQARMPVLPLRNGTFVAGYPSQLLPGPTALFFPGEDGNRSWCYDVEVGAHQLVPQGILPPDSPEVDAMMQHMEDVQFLADGWFDYPAAESQKDPFNLGGFSKVQPYYTRNAEIYAMRDDVKPFVRSYFNTLSSLLNTENLSFQEHFHGAGAWNKTHETGYFLQQTRFMLVMERGDELWLVPMITSNWLKDGRAVAVTNAPTRFGPVSYRITSSVGSGFIEAKIDPPTRSSPKKFVIRLRHPEGKPIRSASVNGQGHRDFTADCVRLDPSAEPIVIRVGY